PSNPTANDLLARVILYLGRLDEAERQARHAVELDPLSVIAQGNLARVLLFAGKLDEADAAARKAAELQPTSASSHRWQVVVAVLRGDGATALREAQLEPDEGYRRFELALAQQIQGDRQAADAALADLIANGRDQLAYQIAEVYAVVSWLLIELAWILLPTLDAPEWMLPAFVVLITLGFVITVFISWSFEMTPEGMKRTADVTPGEALPYWSKRKFARFVIGVAVIAFVLLAYQVLRSTGGHVVAKHR